MQQYIYDHRERIPSRFTDYDFFCKDLSSNVFLEIKDVTYMSGSPLNGISQDGARGLYSARRECTHLAMTSILSWPPRSLSGLSTY